MFGYEGEGFDRARDPEPSGDADADSRDRGWNIGPVDDRAPKNDRRSDDAIREDVRERLTVDHDVDATDLEVRVQEAVVVLSGTAPDSQTRRRAEEVADSVRGVKDVQNELRVARPEEDR